MSTYWETLHEEAKKLMPGGGCAGNRYNAILGHPMWVDHVDGCHIHAADGREFIDFNCCAGSVLFGFNNPQIKEALMKVLDKGFFMNFDTELTLEFAKRFTDFIPTAEQIRLTNSGTEATMAALRLARHYTGKKLIVKMDGHFHGMHEQIFYNYSKYPAMDEYGEVTETVPDTAGIPEEYAEFVKVIDFNNIDAVKHVVEKYKGQIAALIMTPIAYNCFIVDTTKEYLQEVRDICTKEGIVLIYDEVISGMKIRTGSAQTYYGVQPDLSTFAKGVCNGFSMAVVAGKADIMKGFNPVGPVVVSGTSSGNLLSVASAVECMKMASEPDFYDKLEAKEKYLMDGITDLFKKNGVPGFAKNMGATFMIYFGFDDPAYSKKTRDVLAHSDGELRRKVITGLFEEGVYFHYQSHAATGQFSGLGMAHTMEDLSDALERFDKVLAKVK